ncbi:MAG: septal ring lytic transglycosylase RlpA family protein [Candidatus Omnitrophota bacterium]
MKRLKIVILIIISFASGTMAHAMYNRAAVSDEQRAPLRVVSGQASWYSEQSPGVRPTTANMEIFDDSAMTCAMWDVPFGQKLKVTNIKNGRSVIVRVNDRGPHKRYVRRGRVIDLSKGAFQKLSDPDNGLISVRVQFL